MLLFKEFKLIPKLKELEKILIKQKVDTELLDPREKVYFDGKKIIIEKVEEKKNTHRTIDVIRPRHAEHQMF